MAGHSKWAGIKHKKAIVDSRRGKLFTKLARAITVAAKEGGGDPDGNPRLALAISKARDASMPKDNIERAVAKGTGEGADADALEDVVYEGYGPGGVAMLVEAVTDNRNRTASDVRHIFSKNDGNLGATGAVAWLCERTGVALVDAERYDEEDVMLAAADGGAEDVEVDGSSFRITSEPEAVQAVRAALEAAGIQPESADITMLPKTTVEIEDEGTARKVLRLMDALDDNDDVQDVYANFDIPERVLEAVAP